MTRLTNKCENNRCSHAGYFVGQAHGSDPVEGPAPVFASRDLYSQSFWHING
jgi:hypothetical protein